MSDHGLNNDEEVAGTVEEELVSKQSSDEVIKNRNSIS